MSDMLTVKAIDSVLKGQSSLCKFLSANDSGETKSHQSGILIPVAARNMLWTDKEIKENHILKKYGKIKWQNDFKTNCTFTWYESKGEYRITGFGRGKSPINPEHTGALFVLIKDTEEDYQGYFFNTDEDIVQFLDAFGLTPADTNKIIDVNSANPKSKEKEAIDVFIDGLTVDFPNTYDMATAARMIQYNVYKNQSQAIKNPDNFLLKCTTQEYTLFRAIEHARYGEMVSNGFSSVDDFVTMANKVLNRRKSRAGKSLEHHLSAIFDENKLKYSAQAITEGNKKPDFLFPSENAYHNTNYSIKKICTLAAKTTCKDRWRQILNEANRLKDDYKYLCTLQPGITSRQMDEMKEEKVILVVPKAYIEKYPIDRQERIWTIKKFIDYVKEIEEIHG